MQPNYPLTEPQAGQKVSARAIGNLVKSVKALQPSVGYGMRISKNGNGVMYELDRQVIQKVSKTKMPFDCTLISQTANSNSCQVHILKGSLFYGAGNSLVEVQPTDVVGDDYWDLTVSVADGLMLGVVCSYDDYSDVSVPESFTVDSIPDDAELMTAQGLQYYPLVKFIKMEPNQEYGGPYIFSVQVPAEGSGTQSGDKDTYYAIQCYHGDIVFDNNDYSPWVGQIASGGNGSFAVSPVDGSSQNTRSVDVVEIAGCATLPYGSRVIVHRILVESLDAGDL